MSVCVDDIQETGIQFIDDCHPMIASLVNSICSEIKTLNNQDRVLQLVDSLIIQVDYYLKHKNTCCQLNTCNETCDGEAFHQLIDLRNMLEKYSHAVPRDIAITEMKKWVCATILENDIKCRHCNCMRTVN